MEGAWEIHPCSYLTDLCRKSHTHCSKPVMTVLLPNLMFMLALLGGLGWLHLTSLMIYHLAICSSSLDPWIPYHRSLGECNPASVELKPCKWRWALWRNPTRKLPSTSQRGVSMSPHLVRVFLATEWYYVVLYSVIMRLPDSRLSVLGISASISIILMDFCWALWWLILFNCGIHIMHFSYIQYIWRTVRHRMDSKWF